MKKKFFWKDKYIKNNPYQYDTGYFYEEVFEYFEKEKIYFDFISLDCTYGPLCVADDKGHMGIENIQRLTKRLYSINAIDDQTVKYMNHFSHNANPIQDELEKLEDAIKKVCFETTFSKSDCIKRASKFDQCNKYNVSLIQF